MLSDETPKRKKTGGRVRQNLLGRTFGHWTVLTETTGLGPRNLNRWRCRCACGTERDVLAASLLRDMSKSCGTCNVSNQKVADAPPEWVKHDLAGQTFGRWKVIDLAPSSRGKIRGTRWNCECVCGVKRAVRGVYLREGRSKSCGCSQAADRPSMGMSETLEYRSWHGIRQRCDCTDSTQACYQNYAKRGIRYCSRWRVFANFLADVGNAPTPTHSIDRIDNDKGYFCGKPECEECGPLNREPNCRWATSKEQNNNRRKVRSLNNCDDAELIAELERRRLRAAENRPPAE